MHTNKLKKYITKTVALILIFMMLLPISATCVQATTIEDLRNAYNMRSRLKDRIEILRRLPV